MKERGITMGRLLSIDPRLYVVGGIFSSAIAQIALKRAGICDYSAKGWLGYFLLSITCYGIAFVCYYVALRRFDISTIQPIMMVSIVSLIALYGFLVGEHFSYWKVSGIVIAAFSIILISK